MIRGSAGILLFRRTEGALEVLLVHPGGPYFRNKDHGSWSVPKGLSKDGEELLATARREFEEETGASVPEAPLIELGTIAQRGGKNVTAFAVEGDWDPRLLDSNTFTIEWPPRSGRQTEFPEVDRAMWFGLDEAAERIIPAQSSFLVRLAEHLLSETHAS